MTAPTPSPDRHAVLGASSAYRWTACPGSPRLSAGVPRQDTEYSLEGTLAHDVAATRLLGKRWTDKARPCTKDMAAYVKVYTEYVKKAGRGKPIWIEQEVALDNERFGTADCLIWHADDAMLEVVDLKYGAGVLVEVENNPQLLYYALASYRTFRAQGVNPKRLRITIVQPRADHYEGPIRSRDVDVFDLVEWGAWLDERAEATKDPEAPLVPGDHCKFCPAKASCPALREQALAVAQVEFNDQPFAPPAIDTMTLEQMGQVLQRAPILESWLSGVREHVFASLNRGEAVPGWKLVDKRAQRKWVDEGNAANILYRDMGLPWGDIREAPKLRSPAQIEKMLPKEMRSRLEALVSKESSGVTLAPESDSRAVVVKLSAVDEFNDN